jgi:hypothetical protein
VFMTDFVKIALATDRVRPSQAPETWNIGPLVRLAVVLGLFMLVESLGLLALGWHWFGLGADDHRLPTFAFLTLLFFALFSLVSIRERRAFWSSRPSGVLALALAADGCVGVLIGTRGLGELAPLPLAQTAFVVGYALVCSLAINDPVKLALIAHLRNTAADDGAVTGKRGSWIWHLIGRSRSRSTASTSDAGSGSRSPTSACASPPRPAPPATRSPCRRGPERSSPGGDSRTRT